MLSATNSTPRPGRTTAMGFTLIELLVGMAVGIIIVAALVAFIVSSVQANSENLRSIRLTQELRALTEVIGREVRRARYVPAIDLLNAIGVTPVPPAVTRFSGVVVSGNCIEFTYGTDTTLGEGRRFWLENDARIWGSRVNYGPTDATPALTAYCTGTPAGTQAPISSPEVRIDAFDLLTDSDPDCTDTTLAGNSNCNIVNIRIQASIGPPGDAITRTFGQRIRIRSSPNPPPGT